MVKRIFSDYCRECHTGFYPGSINPAHGCPVCGTAELYEAELIECHFCGVLIYPSKFGAHQREHIDAERRNRL